jgi:hypothetical protein
MPSTEKDAPPCFYYFSLDAGHLLFESPSPPLSSKTTFEVEYLELGINSDCSV